MSTNMLTLFCALVGVEGDTFPIEIEANKSVGQLYLAKKDGVWLDELDTTLSDELVITTYDDARTFEAE